MFHKIKSAAVYDLRFCVESRSFIHTFSNDVY